MDEQHVALPKLYGAPAYTRPPRRAEETPKPFDPDELPIAAARTNEEHELIEALPPRAFAPGGGVVLRTDGRRTRLHEPAPGQQRGLRGLAGRLLKGD